MKPQLKLDSASADPKGWKDVEVEVALIAVEYDDRSDSGYYDSDLIVNSITNWEKVPLSEVEELTKLFRDSIYTNGKRWKILYRPTPLEEKKISSVRWVLDQFKAEQIEFQKRVREAEEQDRKRKEENALKARAKKEKQLVKLQAELGISIPAPVPVSKSTK